MALTDVVGGLGDVEALRRAKSRGEGGGGEERGRGDVEVRGGEEAVDGSRQGEGRGGKVKEEEERKRRKERGGKTLTA